MDKNKLIHFIALSLFFAFVIILNVIFLINNYGIEGKVIINKKYYEIIYFSSDDRVIINDKKISLNLKNGNMKSSFKIYNIGNTNATVDGHIIDNINTNLNTDDIKFDLSFDKGSIINKGETREIFIEVLCDECTIVEDNYINFDIKYIFK